MTCHWQMLSQISFWLLLLAAASFAHSTKYVTLEKGTPHTSNYRIFIKEAESGNFVSPWHDIPLTASEDSEEAKTFHMVVEIPRGSKAKMEMATGEAMSPIKQDVKAGKMRFVHSPYIWNYGALPQTWEDPNHWDERTEAKGDNDPIDVVEIGSKVHKSGAVIEVKILGVLALLDEGETDWKLVAIDVTDKMAPKLNDIGDLEKEKPGFLDKTRKWLREYKIPDGKKPNKFAFDGDYQDRTFAHEIIEETHGFWKNLVKMENPELNTECHYPGAKFEADDDKWKKAVEKPRGNENLPGKSPNESASNGQV